MATAGPKERAGLREPPVQKTPSGGMLVVGGCDGIWRFQSPKAGGDSPTSSAMKRLSPIPTGAMKFPWCFSAASMNIVNTSCAVRIISMMTPWAMVVPPPSVVETASSP